MPPTLSSRLTIWYISAFSILLVAAFSIMYFAINEILDYRIDEDLVEDIEEFRELLEAEGVNRVKLEIEREVQSGSLKSVFLRLLDQDLNQLYSSDTSQFVRSPQNSFDMEKLMATDGELLQTVEHSIRDDEETDQEAFREIIGALGEGYFLHIGESMNEKEEMMDTMLYSFAGILFLVLPIAAGIGWFMAKKAVRGITEVSHTAERIHKGHLDERVTITAKDREIIDLSTTFNAMLDRIRDLIREMREMTDNIAHDLKSPLSRIRIISEGALSKPQSPEESRTSATQTIEECDRLLKMINDSLDVAEAEVGIGGNGRHLFDMSSLVHEACELFEPVAEQNGITLIHDIKPGCQYFGNEQEFQRTISNLVDNAVKYTDAGGEVNLSLDYNEQNCRISVADSGIGIPREDRSRVFNRFYRCDHSRSESGCGLGLSYSRAVVRTHGGDITLSSQLDQGSTFMLTLPTGYSV